MLSLLSVLVTWRTFLMNDTATVQTILQRYGDEFLSKYPLNHDQMKAFNEMCIRDRAWELDLPV